MMFERYCYSNQLSPEEKLARLYAKWEAAEDRPAGLESGSAAAFQSKEELKAARGIIIL
jgi:hypothetical protein